MPDPIKMLRARLRDQSLRSLAIEIGVSAAYLSDIMNGHRKAGPKVLEVLGLEKEVVTKYRERNPGSAA